MYHQSKHSLPKVRYFFTMVSLLIDIGRAFAANTKVTRKCMHPVRRLGYHNYLARILFEHTRGKAATLRLTCWCCVLLSSAAAFTASSWFANVTYTEC